MSTTTDRIAELSSTLITATNQLRAIEAELAHGDRGDADIAAATALEQTEALADGLRRLAMVNV